MSEPTDLAQLASQLEPLPDDLEPYDLLLKWNRSRDPKFSKLCEQCFGIGNAFHLDRRDKKLERMPLPRQLRVHECDFCSLLYDKVGAEPNDNAVYDYELCWSRSYDDYELGWGWDREPPQAPRINLARSKVGEARRVEHDLFEWPRSEELCLSMSRCPEQVVLSVRPACPDFEQYRSWLKFCDLRHDVCRTTTSAVQFPRVDNLTVLDCKLGRLALLADGAPYVTLSYVWGPDPPFYSPEALEVQNMERTLKDVREVVVRLGYTHLWVDRYCIPQDGVQKHSLIAQMGAIYAHSDLTIIAAGGDGANDGIPGMSVDRERIPFVLAKDWSLQETQILLPGDELKWSKWNTRGWTYQEGLLSCRRLAFTKTSAYFQCRCMYVDETSSRDCIDASTTQRAGRRVEPALKDINKAKDSQEVIRWIDSYNKREFSHDWDALEAFLGALNVFSTWEQPVYHYYGNLVLPIPRLSQADRLTFGFAWNFKHGWEAGKTCLVRRRNLPSWSWTGWKTAGSVHTELELNLRDIDEFCHRSDVQLFSFRNEKEMLAEITTELQWTQDVKPSAPQSAFRLAVEAWTFNIHANDHTIMLGHQFLANEKSILGREYSNPLQRMELAFKNSDGNYYNTAQATIVLLYEVRRRCMVPTTPDFCVALLLPVQGSCDDYVRLPSLMELRARAFSLRGDTLRVRWKRGDYSEQMDFVRRRINLV